tara:strand:+ start:258 stop:434 length:177 start_codon:yes stop_codon:yes gene_type:complete
MKKRLFKKRFINRIVKRSGSRELANMEWGAMNFQWKESVEIGESPEDLADECMSCWSE